MLDDLILQDKLNRERALDPTKSFIIQAPAGSGKTEILIQRFLALLSMVKTPDEILAITFTKKAANEMRDRIIKALKEAENNIPLESPHKKTTRDLAIKVLRKNTQLNWHLTENPNQLRIQTIDALCTYLTKQLPLLSTFGSPPSIAEDPHFLYREAITDAFFQFEENNEWTTAISQLLLHVDNDLNKLIELLIKMLEKRDQWITYIQLNMDELSVKKELEHHLSLVITDHLHQLKNCMPKEIIPELLAIVRFAAGNIASEKVSSPILACLDLVELPSTSPDDKEKWLGFATLLLTKSFTWRKRFDSDLGFKAKKNIENFQAQTIQNDYKRRLTCLIESISEREELRKCLEGLFFLPDAVYQAAQWEILKSLLSVLKIVVAFLRLSFQQHGQIDFVENGRAALIALGDSDNPTDLALSLDYQLQHILIDEFQDTSHTQFQLLEKLTAGWETHDGRTLFVVGDPMQSIYRFREAEVGLFIRMIKHGIGDIKLIPLTLTRNFRSTKTITHWNNVHFAKIFPALDDIASGAVSYTKCISRDEEEKTQINLPSIVKLEGLINADHEIQAASIVDLIQNIKRDRPNDKIAILVRSRTHLSALIPALKKAKINYCAHEIDLLAKRQSIQDLLSLTIALLHPANRIAWLSVLRAPWCGLTLSDLLNISAPDSQKSILAQLKNIQILQTLSDDAKCRLARVLPILENKVFERGRYDLRYWIESTWLELGGPASLSNDCELDDINTYFALLNTLDVNNEILSFENLKEKVNQLYASTRDDDSLQIMTIHAAKGLEFDTVIIPHLERKGMSDDKSLLLWLEQVLTDGNRSLLLAPIPANSNHPDSIYTYINRELKMKSDHERDRLFYVAATRAIRNLYLFFNINEKNDEDFKIEAGSFLEKLWPQIEKQKDNIIKKPYINNESPISVNKPRYLIRLISSWANPIEKTLVTLTSHQKSSGFILPDNKLKVIGTLTHFILQKISLNGIPWWQNQATQNQIAYIKNHLQRYYISDDQRESCALRIQTMIQNTLQCKYGQWILHPHHFAKSEFAISGYIEDKIENFIIDRTFIDENGIRWIIDYKTRTESYDDLETFLKNEEKKYIIKMKQYALIMKRLSDHPIRIALYFPALPFFRELNLDVS